ncbi:MAG TPA: tetratricopeptide repeat protein, partial [Terriglobia bacterium]|nr:tetratricopeptide repeat protein [Terriglobia bacterium]
LPAILVALAIAATANHYFKTREAAQLIIDSARLTADHHPGRATSLLEEARRLDPNNVAVREQLGALYLQAKQYPQAIHEFQQALHFSPFSGADMLRLATAYEQSGNLSKARDLLEEAGIKMPQDVNVQEELAEVYAELKLFPEAIRSYQRVLQLAPNFPLALNNLAWLYATCPDARYRNPSAALQAALRAAQLTAWKQPDFVDTLAAALYVNGKANLAVKVETKALQLDPKNQAFQDNLLRYRHAAKP